jgi:hypothetical protein
MTTFEVYFVRTDSPSIEDFNRLFRLMNIEQLGCEALEVTAGEYQLSFASCESFADVMGLDDTERSYLEDHWSEGVCAARRV